MAVAYNFVVLAVGDWGMEDTIINLLQGLCLPV